MRACPALFISAPASHQGKTTVTAALAAPSRAGSGGACACSRRGPDFLDPMILERASGSPVYSLHLWMVGADACRALLADAARDADLILIEGVMGLFDGTPSSADLAAAFGVPVLAVIGAHGMAQTFGALAFGLARLSPRPAVPWRAGEPRGVGASCADARRGDTRGAALLRPPAEDGRLRAARPPSRAHAARARSRTSTRVSSRAADAIGETALRELPPAVPFEDQPVAKPAAPARRHAHRDRARRRVFVHLSGEHRPARSARRDDQHVLPARRRAGRARRRRALPARRLSRAARGCACAGRARRRRSARTWRAGARWSPNAAACCTCSTR